MINYLPRNIARLLFLVFLQVAILNYMQLSKFNVYPMIYVLFIILLPFETPKWLLIIAGFFLGISVDIFTDTFGLHASATVLMAFIRPYTLRVIAPRDGYEIGTFPRIHYYGFNWFFKYAAVLIFAHHLFYYYVEVFKISELLSTFIKVVLSTMFSSIIIVISQYLIFRK